MSKKTGCSKNRELWFVRTAALFLSLASWAWHCCLGPNAVPASTKVPLTFLLFSRNFYCFNRLDPTRCSWNDDALRQRIYRSISRNGLVNRRRTDIAESSRHNIDEETDFLSCVNEDIAITALLGVTMSGEKLPAFIVFIGTRNGRIMREIFEDIASRGSPAGVVMSIQKSGWIDEELMLEWIYRVLKPCVKQHISTYHIMDCFKLSFFVKNQF